MTSTRLTGLGLHFPQARALGSFPCQASQLKSSWICSRLTPKVGLLEWGVGDIPKPAELSNTSKSWEEFDPSFQKNEWRGSHIPGMCSAICWCEEKWEEKKNSPCLWEWKLINLRHTHPFSNGFEAEASKVHSITWLWPLTSVRQLSGVCDFTIVVVMQAIWDQVWKAVHRQRLCLSEKERNPRGRIWIPAAPRELWDVQSGVCSWTRE